MLIRLLFMLYSIRQHVPDHMLTTYLISLQQSVPENNLSLNSGFIYEGIQIKAALIFF